MTGRVFQTGGAPTAEAWARDSDGFAAVDAIVALLILSVTLIAGIQAQLHAARLTARADEIGRVDRLVRQLMWIPTDGYAPLEGAQLGFAWSVRMEPLDADLPVPICRRQVQVTAKPDARVYRAAMDQICPLEAAGA